jgi:predicted regulator of Ras-like GTPase activity (Roadblock/LC7/MglB family)
MDDELYSFALKNTLDEIRNLCPDITNAFMFKEDGEIIASDEITPQQSIVHVIDDFDRLLEKAETMGGIEQITIEGSKGRVNVSHMNNNYLVTITSQSADKNYVNMISRVLFKTVVKLLDKISPAALRNNLTEPEPELQTVIEKNAETTEQNDNEPEIKEAEASEQPSNEPEIKEAEPAEPSTKPEAACAETMANQFMVEDLQGLLVKADTVRVDEATLQQWQQLCDDQRIEEVEIETFTGQSMRVKIKPIKDQKQEGKGIVQMPQKIQQMLEIRKGELVKLKPIIG